MKLQHFSSQTEVFKPQICMDRQELIVLLKSRINFASDVEFGLSANGCTYSVSQIDYLQQLYEKYAHTCYTKDRTAG